MVIFQKMIIIMNKDNLKDEDVTDFSLKVRGIIEKDGSFLVGRYDDVYLLPGGNKVIYLRLISYLSRIEPQRGLMSIIVFFIGFINLLFWKKLISINNQNSDYLRLINLGVFFWGLFSFNVTLSLRISSYFLIFILLLVPSFIPLFKKKVAARSMIILFLSVYFASSFYVNIKGYTPSPSDRISYLPYQTVFYYKDYQNYKYRPR